MNDIDQMRMNELARLERAVASRERMLAQKTSKQRKLVEVPHRYHVSLPITPQSNTENLQAVTRSFVVDRKSNLFLCREMSATAMVVGTINSGDAGKVSMPAFLATATLTNPQVPLSYEWQVSDTYRDRSWQSANMPDLAIATGKGGPLRFARPCPLPPGTEVFFTVIPLNAPTSLGYIASVTSYSLEVSFIGSEVIG